MDILIGLITNRDSNIGFVGGFVGGKTRVFVNPHHRSAVAFRNRAQHGGHLGERFFHVPAQLDGGITNVLFVAFLVFGEPLAVVVAFQFAQKLE